MYKVNIKNEKKCFLQIPQIYADSYTISGAYLRKSAQSAGKQVFIQILYWKYLKFVIII